MHSVDHVDHAIMWTMWTMGLQVLAGGRGLRAWTMRRGFVDHVDHWTLDYGPQKTL